MTVARIIVIAFFVLAMIALFVVIKSNIFKPAVFKKYFIATTLVYISGTILVFAVVFANKLMPWNFAIASEVSILFVYVFSMYMIHRMGNNMLSISEEIAKRKEENEKKE